MIGAISSENDSLNQKRQKVQAVFDEALKNQQADWVIVGKRVELWMPYYVPVAQLFTEPDIFIPVTGATARPEILLARNPILNGGEFPLVDSTYAPLFVQGWDMPSYGMRWTSGEHSVIQIALESGYDYSVNLELQPTCITNKPAVKHVDVGWGENSLGEIDFDTCLPSSHSFHLPAGWIEKGLNDLWITSPPQASAVGISGLSFVQK